MIIYVKNNDPIKAFKLLNRKLHSENIFEELKEREYYKSKGAIRREKRKKAISRIKKEQAKRQALFDRIENQLTRGNNDRRNNSKPRTNRN